MRLVFDRRSLGTRLSQALALQTLLGLALVSTLVFLAIERHLRERQGVSLDEIQALVLHLMEEGAAATPIGEIEHSLRDQLSTREDLHLELFDAAGAPLLHVGDGVDPASWSGPSYRSRELELPETARRLPGSPVHARIAIGISRDRALLLELGLTLAAATLLGSTIVSIAAAVRVQRGLAPVARLVRQIDTLDAHRLRRLDGEEQPTEFQPLVARFNALLGRLDASYRQMAAFNADVAHELRTPLATLMVGNELALRGEADEAAFRELIGSNLEELASLSAIVRDMLFLATAERGARARTEPLSSLAAEIATVVDYHEAALEETALGVDIRGDIALVADRQLLRRAVSNLIGNAARHAEPATTIRIDVAPEPSSGRVRLAVGNRGETVPAAELARFFDRFYRGVAPASVARRDARCERTPADRHGLGLAIVGAVARMHGGSVFARSRDGWTVVGMTLPGGAVSVPPDAAARRHAVAATTVTPEAGSGFGSPA